MLVEIEIPRIQPKERPQVSYTTRNIYTPRKTTSFESEVRFIYNIQSGYQFEGAVRVTCMFYIHKPKTVKRGYPTVIPDTDNLVKAVLDGLNPKKDNYGRITLGAWKDDSQVIEVHAYKRYTEGADKTIVRIEDYV